MVRINSAGIALTLPVGVNSTLRAKDLRKNLVGKKKLKNYTLATNYWLFYMIHQLLLRSISISLTTPLDNLIFHGINEGGI